MMSIKNKKSYLLGGYPSILKVSLFIVSLFFYGVVQAQNRGGIMQLSDVTSISSHLLSDQWQRGTLSLRDRSLITIAVAISRNEPLLLDQQIQLGLDNGLTASQINAIIVHLSFYSGLGQAMEANCVAQQIFTQRHIEVVDIDNQSMPIDKSAEEQRVNAVNQSLQQTFTHLTEDTTEILFHNLWLRPDLTPRERSMVTIASLLANGQSGQIGFHLNKAMDNGFTQEQAEEMLSHLSFYIGWPNAFSATPVMMEVFKHRQSLRREDE